MPPQESTSASPEPADRSPERGLARNGVMHLPVLLLAVGLGFVILISGAALDVLVQHHHPTLWSAIEPSNWVAGLVAVALFYRILLYERERRDLIRRRLEIVAEINHHIRNAVYVISLSTHSSHDQEMVKLIQDSLKRIDWTLKEILPKL